MYGEVTPRNQGMPWYAGDENLLVEWFCRGDPITEIAAWLGRSTTAIRCRLDALGYSDTLEGGTDMSKAPNRYLILGVRHGHVKRLVSRRGYTPDDAITQALRADDLYAKSPGGGHQCLILIEIKDASKDVGAPLNTEVRIIERDPPPVPPYRLVSLSSQGC